MRTYLRRMVKYLLYLIVLFLVIFIFMSLTGAVDIGFSDIGYMFSSKNGMLMIGAFILLGLLQPIMGYIKREMNINPVSGRDTILNVAQMCGYSLTHEDDSEMVFHATSKFKKLIMLYEDEIVIRKNDIPASISGNRRMVTTLLFRIESFK